MRNFVLTFCMLASNLAFAADTAPVPAAGAPAYTLNNTEVHSLPAKNLQRSYQVFVSLPESYASSQKRYPVLFTADADYAFPLIRSISRRIGDHGRHLQEFILVGLSYAQGDSPQLSRNRDYTPTDTIAKKSADPGQEGPYGQAEGYRQYLASQVLPFIAQRYRTDPQHKIFIGHSYGALFGMHVLLTAPEMFDDYILSSPSLWFDKHVLFDVEQAYSSTHKDLRANVWMYTGEMETVRKGKPGYNQTNDMVQDMLAMEKKLKSRKYPHLKIRSQVIREEDHLSVNPVSITRGLKAVLASQRQS